MLRDPSGPQSRVLLSRRSQKGLSFTQQCEQGCHAQVLSVNSHHRAVGKLTLNNLTPLEYL